MLIHKPIAALLTGLALAAAHPAFAQCIDPPNTRNKYVERTLFDVGGSTFGASMNIEGGMWTAADIRAVLAALPPWMQGGAPATDYVYVFADADADLSFFGQEVDILTLNAKAKRESGSFTRTFKIEVAGIDLYVGSNTLTSTMRTIGPYSQVFYTVVQTYGIATARASIIGEIGMNARAVASTTSGLQVEGRMEGALILEGSAGVSLVLASAGLHGAVDLLELGMDFNHRTGLTAGSTYDFYSTYDASTLDGSLALKAGPLGATTTVWSDTFNGYPIAFATLYDANGCVR